MRRIGVLTSDFALYHDLVRALRDRGVAFTSLAFGERPEPGVGVVLTSWRDSVGGALPDGVPVVVVPVDREGRQDIEGAIAQAERVVEGVHGYAEVIVGIDPGPRPGVALLADGRLVHATQVYRLADAAPLVRGLFDQYPHERGLVRIGHQAPRERDAIVAALWPLRADGIRLEIVDERGTTPLTGSTDLPPDVAAAVAIARTPGQAPPRPPRPRVATGQVREIQRASRVATGGRLTISRDEATRVARGEQTLAEAIEAEASRKRKSRPGRGASSGG